MSLYGDAIAAMRRVVLLDERVVRASEQLRDLALEVRSLRDRVSRLEGVIVGLTASGSPGSPTKKRLPK